MATMLALPVLLFVCLLPLAGVALVVAAAVRRRPEQATRPVRDD